MLGLSRSRAGSCCELLHRARRGDICSAGERPQMSSPSPGLVMEAALADDRVRPLSPCSASLLCDVDQPPAPPQPLQMR